MITILTTGSRGDTQPYIALAIELKKLGYAVKIVALKEFEGLVKAYSIDFAPINLDINEIADQSTIHSAMTADNPLKLMISFNKMKKYAILMLEEMLAACEDSELIIYHPGAAIGYFIAQKKGIPCVLGAPFPMTITKEYPSVIMYGRVKSSKWINHLSYIILQKALWTASNSAIKTIWKQKFGAIPKKYKAPFELQHTISNPTITACSPHVFPKPLDWPGHVHQTGYWFIEDDSNYTPSEELASFLDNGPAPVYVGFGSISVRSSSKRITDIIIDALQKTGQRGILATGWNGIEERKNLPDSIHIIDSAPHSWLFKRVCMVVHHGGAGTTAAGLKEGVPTAIIPFGNDQFAWGARIYDMGVGAKPIPIKKLTSDGLAEAIAFSLSNRIILNAKELGEKIGKEQGAKNAALIVSKAMPSY